MRKYRRFLGIISALLFVLVVVILFNVSIRAIGVPRIVIQKRHSGYIESVSISRDGKYLFSGTGGHTVHLWDAKTGKEIRTFDGHTAIVKSVALSGDGQTLVSGSEDKTVRLWDVKTGKEIRTFKGHISVVTSVGISGDGQILVSGSDDKTVRVGMSMLTKNSVPLLGIGMVLHPWPSAGTVKHLSPGVMTELCDYGMSRLEKKPESLRGIRGLIP